jgi:microcin C transport system substrate-binding protein
MMLFPLRLAALLLSLGLGVLPLTSFAQEPTKPATPAASATSDAGGMVWHNGISLIDTPKYAAGFAHFDYVNPDAPKGGEVRLTPPNTMLSFDSFNPILDKGQAVIGLGLVYETLLTPSLDESETSYGLLAEALSWPDDYSSVTFKLNPRAKWQDGQPVTAEDVVWSFNQLVANSISSRNYYRNVTKAEVTGPGQVTFTFDEKNNRELPSIVGQLLVLPKHWWEGTDANGKKRDIGQSTLEPPMGSGPYKMASFSPGRTVIYKRDPNYWGANEPVNIGSDNFDTIRYDYYRDQDVAFEGFKSDQFDWWTEYKAQHWAQAYNFPAVEDGRVVKATFPNPYRDSGVMWAFIPNLRRPMFQDERVRRALNDCFDFESLNKTLFFGQYERINSYFFGTPLASSGLPQGKELEILNAVKDKVPASVFTTPYTNPVGGADKLRSNLRDALNLLGQAGYSLDGNRLVDKTGRQLGFEILLNGGVIAPVAEAFQKNLRAIGINATLRVVDSAQYINRVRSRDYDMIYNAWGESLSPGNEQRDFWGSAAADQPNSRNYAGIADPGVDALIDAVIHAPDRDTLVAATHALDRVLLAHNYVIPSYTLRYERDAYWNRFGHPDPLPEYAVGFPSIWWYDRDKAAKTGGPAG